MDFQHFSNNFLLLSSEAKDSWLIVFIVVLFLASLFVVFPTILKKFIYHVLMGIPSFDENFSFNKKNLRFAYKIAGCHIVASDLGKRKEQYLFLVSYLKRKFPGTGKIDLSVLPELHKNFDNVTQVFKWMGMHLNETQKLEFVDYLVDLAFYNEKLSSREMKVIYNAGDQLEMSRKEIRSILSIRYKFYQDKKERERKHRRKTRKTRTPSRSKKNEAYKILGISDFSTSFDEVKKVYRDLAKKYHPDRFYNSSEEEQEKANERFAVINEAYEYLETVLV